MSDKWSEYRKQFCGCKDASRLNSCKALANCSLRAGHPERKAPKAGTAQSELAALREELATANRAGPPHFCGLPMSLNPHPEAGVPGRFLEVGTVSECIPCLVASRHGWAKTASDLQQRLTAAEQRNAELGRVGGIAAAYLQNDHPALASMLRNAIKPTESGASE
jgi:hypothetical protein